ncbi:MAG: ATP-dependent helicase [Clostridiales bacterium]|jgi:DNA helicase-2/ATP-dependent DNA helicase PcrA|nr:ATP-dependent helicase [Clostridiales bacterium]
MMELNDLQRSAVNHSKGPALVLSGPGSGKTSVIVKRIERLLEEEPGTRILSLTFSNNAADEMRVRCEKAISEKEVSGVLKFSTIHSFCNKIIYYYEKTEGITYRRIESDDISTEKFTILSEIYYRLNNVKISSEELTKLSGWISRYTVNNSYIPQIKRFKEICEQYKCYKGLNRLIDFDDMILLACKLLREVNYLKDYWSSKYEYIQVDEGQDMSLSQFETVKILAGNENLFIVADDDQSIYGFRGAAPQNILDFKKFYPEGVIYILSQNYRSSRRIVNLSLNVVRNNKTRYDKELFTENGKGKKPEFLSFQSGWGQAKYIYNEIRDLKHSETIGILYRNNISALLISLLLTFKNIRYSISGSLVDPRENWIVKIILNKLEEEEKKKSILVKTPFQVYKNSLDEGLEQKARNFCDLTGQQRAFTDIWIDYIKNFCRLGNSKAEILNLFTHLGENRSDSVFLSTIHSAKGLEYDKVCIVDLINGEFPGEGALKGELLEEERRLFYVGISRAKSSLQLLYPRRRGNTENEPSIFYTESRKVRNLN